MLETLERSERGSAGQRGDNVSQHRDREQPQGRDLMSAGERCDHRGEAGGAGEFIYVARVLPAAEPAAADAGRVEPDVRHRSLTKICERVHEQEGGRGGGRYVAQQGARCGARELREEERGGEERL